EIGSSVELLTSDVGNTFGPLERPDPELVRTTLVPSLVNWKLRVIWSPYYGRAVKRATSGGIVHVHGLWLPISHSAILAARASRAPIVVSPRGALNVNALSHKSLKKTLAWYLYQKRDLTNATVFHATSSDEAAAIRKSGLTQPIAVIPNGV